MEVRDVMKARQPICQQDRKIQAHQHHPLHPDGQVKVIRLNNLRASRIVVVMVARGVVHQVILHQVITVVAIHLPEVQEIVVEREGEDNHCVFKKC